MKRQDTLIPMDKLIKGRVYKIRSRNLSIGVWDGEGGFIGIRTKFGDRYLFTEYHYDACSTFGTVCDTEDLGINIPENILLKTSLGSIDSVTRRSVDYDVNEGGKGWYFTDNGESSREIKPVSVGNKSLLNFLDNVIIDINFDQ